MHLSQIILYACLFLFAISAIHRYTRRSTIPMASWMMILGGFYGFFALNYYHKFSIPILEPELVLLVFLPILIFESGRKLKLEDLKKHSLTIMFFSTLGMLIVASLIGLAISYFMGIDFTHGLLFGSIIAATDTISVSSILEKFHIPEEIKTKVEGESIFNDATTVLLFTIITAIIFQNQEINLQVSLAKLIWSFIGAITFGTLIGKSSFKLLKFWEENDLIEIILTVVLAYSSFLIAENVFEVSGVIACLCAAVAFTNNEDMISCKKSELFDRFWALLGLILSSALFFLLGISFGTHMIMPSLVIIITIAAVIISRSLLVYLFSPLLNLLHGENDYKTQHIMNLSGIKGAISAALILMLPVSYENREIFLCLTYIVTLFTLIINPIILNKYLQKSCRSTKVKEEEIIVA